MEGDDDGRREAEDALACRKAVPARMPPQQYRVDRPGFTCTNSLRRLRNEPYAEASAAARFI